MLLARFRERYEFAWRDRSYQTRNGIIPFRLFWIYLRALDAQFALERVQMTRAVGTAIGVAFAKKDAAMPQSLRDDLTRSYQE